MYKLLSLSDDPQSMARFDGKPENVCAVLAENGFDGIELMRWHDPQPLPGVAVIGRHMPYWPVWLDFWRGDKSLLLRQFDSEENVRWYYGAATREEFVRQRRAELFDAAAMGAKYAVFHVSHVELMHCYTRQYTYSDEDIVRAFVELVNEAAVGFDSDMTLLFENHWYPGLKLTRRAMAEMLMTDVRYPQKGFVLDISHMMLAAGVKTEPDAVDAILGHIKGLGDMAAHIHTVHLNSAAGVQPQEMDYHPKADFQTRLMEAFSYVGNQDPHGPFLDNGIRRVIEAADPEFLVYELSFKTRETLDEVVRRQDSVFNKMSDCD